MTKIKKALLNNWIIISIISLCIATLNSLRVIVGWLQTPKGYSYLAVGHYYQDHFEYSQQIAQGIFGHWLVQNQFTTNDPTRTLIGWGQYIFIGKFALLFRLSPFAAYWVSIFVFSIIFCFLCFMVIRRLLPNTSFFLQLSAFLFTFFSAPFVNIVRGNAGGWAITPYDFWYAPTSLFHRIGGVPHHILTSIFVLLSIILIDKIIRDISSKHVLSLLVQTFILIVILMLLVTFGPLQVINLLSAVGVIGLIYIWEYFKIEKRTAKTYRLLLFLTSIYLCVIPFAFIIKQFHESGELFRWVMAWEIAQQSYPPFSLLLLVTGPILIFIPFGLQKYFRTKTPITRIVFFLPIFSSIYAFSSLAIHFGTFNLRFLTPLSYLLFSVLAVLGMDVVSKRLPNAKAILSFLVIGFLSYFVAVTLIVYRSLGPVNPISYQPTELIEGLKTLNQQQDAKSVLTSPAQSLGMIVPCIIDRNVYVGRMFFTPNYEEKIWISDQFYQGTMGETKAYALLKENDIGYVLLSSTEPYSVETLLAYPFLKKIYANDTLTIFKLQE